jgi:hypothetical protein
LALSGIVLSSVVVVVCLFVCAAYNEGIILFFIL